MGRVSKVCFLGLGVLLVGMMGAGCETSDEEKLEKIKEQLPPGKSFVPLGATNKLLLPELKAKAKESPEDFQAQFALATSAVEAGEIPTALEAAKQAVRLDANSNPAKEIYAHCLQLTGQMAEAGAIWEALAASGHPYSAVIDSNLGNFYKAQGRVEEAEKSYRKSLEVRDHPQETLVRVNLADLLIKKEQFEEAKKLLQDGLAENPKLQHAHQLLGRGAFLQGDFVTAASEFKLELELRPMAWEAYYLMGLSFGRQNPPQMDKAEEAFQELQALRPGESAYFKALLADLYVDAGNPEKGKTLATEALAEIAAFREDQKNAAYHVLAKAFKKLGDTTSATEFRQKFQQSGAEVNPNDPEQRRRIREMDSLFTSP